MWLPSSIKSMIFRQYNSVDDYWRKRVRWGEWNRILKHQWFISDGYGYNLPLLGNHFYEKGKWTEYKNVSRLYEYSPGGHLEHRRPWADAMFEMMYNMIKYRVKKDDVILDVACNSGYQGENFHKKGFTNIWGIDPQKSAIEYAKKHRPFLNSIEGYFGLPEYDIICDLMVWFDSIARIPYSIDLFGAMDRSTTKYILITCMEAVNDFNRDYHVGLAKKGFVCIEKHVVTEEDKNNFIPDIEFKPIGFEGSDGPMIILGDKDKNIPTQRKFRSFMLFRRVEPRPPAPKVQNVNS